MAQADLMIKLFARIFGSLFSLPVWVIVWMLAFLIPANLSGFLYLDTISGRWIAGLGGGALLINTVLVLMNGGFSRVLAIPHLILWGPLEIVLILRAVSAEMGPEELWLVVTVMVINGISLVFDIIDTRRWYSGERDVFGFEGQPVRV